MTDKQPEALESLASSIGAAPYSIDADPQGIRATVADAITGALAFGAQGVNQPPEGNWLAPFWNAARADRAAPQPSPTAQSASSAVLKAIREANMQLVRTGDNAFMLVPYKVATAQAADRTIASVSERAAAHVNQQLGGCPDCGSRNCVARECTRTMSHKVQVIPGVQWQCGPQASGFTAQAAESVPAPAPPPECETEAEGWSMGDRVRYADHVTALAAGQATAEQQGAHAALSESFLEIPDVQAESGINAYYSREVVLEYIDAALASRGQAPAVKREFTNELGNSIRITVEGPNSMHENIVTPMEAKQLREALNEHAQKSAPAGATLVHLDHIACIDGGELRYITGRKAPAYDCELYAMPNGGSAPPLYTAHQPSPAAQGDENA